MADLVTLFKELSDKLGARDVPDAGWPGTSGRTHSCIEPHVVCGVAFGVAFGLGFTFGAGLPAFAPDCGGFASIVWAGLPALGRDDARLPFRG